MKITPYDINKLGAINGYVKSNNLKILEEFANSNHECVKVEDYSHKTPTGCYTSLFKSIKTYNMTGIRVCIRGKDVFLVKVKPK